MVASVDEIEKPVGGFGNISISVDRSPVSIFHRYERQGRNGWQKRRPSVCLKGHSIGSGTQFERYQKQHRSPTFDTHTPPFNPSSDRRPETSHAQSNNQRRVRAETALMPFEVSTPSYIKHGSYPLYVYYSKQEKES